MPIALLHPDYYFPMTVKCNTENSSASKTYMQEPKDVVSQCLLAVEDFKFNLIYVLIKHTVTVGYIYT